MLIPKSLSFKPLVMRFWQGSLLLQFAWLSLLVVVVIGVVLSWILFRLIESHALNELASEAQSTLYTRVMHQLKPEDMIRPMSGQRYADFQHFVENSIVSERTRRIKIYNNQGVVIYSDESSIVGKSFPITDHMKQAFSGKVAFELSSLQEAENIAERQYGRLMEVYVPLVFPGTKEVQGALEIYQSYVEVARQIRITQTYVFLGLAGGLVLLYGTLFGLVKRGSDTIQSQQRDLNALYLAGQHIRSTLSTQEILKFIVHYATLLMGGTWGLLIFYDKSRQVISSVDSGFSSPNDAQLYLNLVNSLPSPITNVDEATLMPLPSSAPLPSPLLLSPIKIQGKNQGLLAIARSAPKPMFSSKSLALMDELGGHASVALEQAQLVEDLRRATEELQGSYQGTLEALARALDLRDRETGDHSFRVAQLTVAVARAMGVLEESLVYIERGALLHDVGKIGIPDSILGKPGPLSPKEWAIIKQHPVFGYQMLSQVSFLKDSLRLILYHQERYDGSGYPEGLKGEAIPLEARVFAVADVYDALTSKRPYRDAISREEALEEIRREAGTKLDPKVVEVFLRVIGQERSQGASNVGTI